ncbi:MAG: DUF1294 domain-containing protein [Planctomycetota bacterium]
MRPATALALAALALNLATAALYAWDKRAARLQRWRVSERTLLGAALLGGWPGAWASMSLVRHKTQKRSFRLRLAAITGVWLLALGAFAWLRFAPADAWPY